MRTIGPLLAVASLLLVPVAWAAPQEVPADRIGPVLGRLAKMKRAEQKAWLERLEAREARAAKIAQDYDAPPPPPSSPDAQKPKLKPEEAAKEIAAVRGLIHRKIVTWKLLREAIEKTDAREQDARERLRQRYRDQVFDTFYTHIDEYGRRQDAWNAVWQSWIAAGAPFEPQDQMIDWLEAATGSADPKKIGPLPKKPDFSEAAAGVTPPAEKKPEEPAKPPVEKKKPDEPAKPPAEIKKPEGPAKPPAEMKKPDGPAKPLAEKKAPPAKKQSGAAGDVEVNVGELAARIAGYNLDLRALETDLDESGTWDAARLAPMVDRLKILVVRRGDLDLFREAVPAGKRLDLARLDSPRTASAELGAKIAAARDRAAGASFTGTEAQRRKETDRLDQLSRRLAEAAGK